MKKDLLYRDIIQERLGKEYLVQVDYIKTEQCQYCKLEYKNSCRLKINNDKCLNYKKR